MDFFTIGYEGQTIDVFIKMLQEHNIEVLADVRLTPISRKKGFSKKALSQALADAGIKYVHFRELGNPKENRATAKSAEECLAAFAQHMEPRWSDALEGIVAQIAAAPTCLMCFERDACTCHRTVIAQELQRRHPDAAVRAL